MYRKSQLAWTRHIVFNCIMLCMGTKLLTVLCLACANTLSGTEGEASDEPAQMIARRQIMSLARYLGISSVAQCASPTAMVAP